ncbi:MAG: flagellar biosynthetic protein FliO [Clostridiales bacterium]|nr:flagellar biosynthetic protein FliO [Clostridiales bacterium]
MGASKHIRIIDRVFLGNDKSVCIIQVGERFFLIGVTNHHIGDISEIQEADLVPLTVQKNNAFNSLFEVYIRKFRQNPEDSLDERDRIQQIKESLENQRRKMKDL